MTFNASMRRCPAGRTRNHCHMTADQIGGECRQLIRLTESPAILDCYIVTVDPAEFAQSLNKSGGPFAGGRTRTLAKEPNGR